MISENIVIEGLSPDNQTFQRVEALLKKRALHYQADVTTGVIITDWFAAHKGEVKLRIEASVSDRYARFEVWQDVGWFFSSYRKTRFCRLYEKVLTEEFYGIAPR